MSIDPIRYARREFLGHFAAVPLAISAVANMSTGACGAEDVPLSLLNRSKMPETELAKEVESLLKLVDPQVIYRYTRLPDEQNAWPFWKQAGDAFTDESEDDEFQDGMYQLDERGVVPPPHVWKRIRDWLRQNDESRTLTDAGIKRGGLELPRAKKSIRLSLVMDEASLFRNLARLKGLASRSALYREETDVAIIEAASILQMGVIFIRSECLIVDYLIALAILRIGVQTMFEAATAPGVSDEQARAALSSLANAKVTNEDVKQACRVEFCRWFLPYVASFPKEADRIVLVTHYFAADLSHDFKPTERQAREYDRSIRQIAKLLERHAMPFDKEATIRLGNQLHLRHFEELEKPWLERKRGFLEEIQKKLTAWPDEVQPNMLVIHGLGDSDAANKLTDDELRRARDELATVDNVFGKQMLMQALSTIMSAATVETFQVRLEAARIRIALRAYERKYRRLPIALAGLIEDKYIPEQPRDPFDGQAFKYSADRRVIWSVGDEGKNEGLVPEMDDPENPFDEDFELTWRIPSP